MQIKLLIKKAKILFYLNNISECWKNLELAQEKLVDERVIKKFKSFKFMLIGKSFS